MLKLKILQKTYNMAIYGHTCLKQFPKDEKHVMAADIRRSMYRLLRLIIRANKRRNKRKCLDAMDEELDVLRIAIRLAAEEELRYLQELYAAGEIGFNEVNASVQGYMGLLKHCDSYNLRKSIFESLVFARSANDEPKFEEYKVG